MARLPADCRTGGYLGKCPCPLEMLLGTLSGVQRNTSQEGSAIQAPPPPVLTVVLIGFESLVSLFGTKTMLWAFVSAAGFRHFIFVQSVCFVIGSSLWFSFLVFSILSPLPSSPTPSKLAPLPLSWCSVYNTRVLRATEKRQCFCLGLAYFT